MERERTTTDAGIPAPSDEHSLTAGPNGPILLQDHYLIQKMAQFNRERVPERVVHAKGAGAHGYFESFEDVSDWTKAQFLRKGTRTPAFVRFSTVAGEQVRRTPCATRAGSRSSSTPRRATTTSSATTRRSSSSAIRRSSPTSSTPRSAAPTPACATTTCNGTSGRCPPNRLIKSRCLFSDRGTPRTFRNMNGYGSHTFTWVNAKDEAFFVKYHFKTDDGHPELHRRRSQGHDFRRPRLPSARPARASGAR